MINAYLEILKQSCLFAIYLFFIIFIVDVIIQMIFNMIKDVKKSRKQKELASLFFDNLIKELNEEKSEIK